MKQILMSPIEIGKWIDEDWLPLFQWYKRIDREGSAWREKIQNAADAGFAVVGHDARYVFMLPAALSNFFEPLFQSEFYITYTARFQ